MWSKATCRAATSRQPMALRSDRLAVLSTRSASGRIWRPHVAEAARPRGELRRRHVAHASRRKLRAGTTSCPRRSCARWVIHHRLASCRPNDTDEVDSDAARHPSVAAGSARYRPGGRVHARASGGCASSRSRSCTRTCMAHTTRRGLRRCDERTNPSSTSAVRSCARSHDVGTPKTALTKGKASTLTSRRVLPAGRANDPRTALLHDDIEEISRLVGFIALHT